MNVGAALRRGFDTLGRYPALLLFPLLWDLAQLGLHYGGLPTGPDWATVQLGPQPTPDTIRGFVPTPLPSLANLPLPMAPALQTPPGLMPAWMLLMTLILVPVTGALVTALFLGLLGDAVVGRALSWRRALSNWPAFAALALAARLLPLLLPVPVAQVLLIIGAIFFGLLPFAVGVLGLPLLPALRAAPGLLWGRIGTWIGLALASTLITLAASAVWAVTERSPLVALLFYPALGTALVAAAAALCLQPEEPATTATNPLWWLLVVAVTVGGAKFGGDRIGAWKGWLPSREAALTPEVQPPFLFGLQRHPVLRVIPQPEGELVVTRGNDGNGLGVAALRRGRFGWQPMSSQTWGSNPSSGQPGVYYVSSQPDGGGQLYRPEWLVVGELFDNRVAYLQIGKDRFPVGQDGPIFVILRPLESAPNPPYAWLDSAGQPVPVREVKRP